MSLRPGDRLGPYGISAPLVAGGMGEVCRARDTRLGRDVAIEALPAAMAADAERIARFQREARLLAALSHPNIAENFVGTARRDLMDHVIVLNEKHLQRLLAGLASYDLDDRTHLSRKKDAPLCESWRRGRIQPPR